MYVYYVMYIVHTVLYIYVMYTYSTLLLMYVYSIVYSIHFHNSRNNPYSSHIFTVCTVILIIYVDIRHIDPYLVQFPAVYTAVLIC
jgi:hypothetical protein